jgi:hypothetical protein
MPGSRRSVGQLSKGTIIATDTPQYAISATSLSYYTGVRSARKLACNFIFFEIFRRRYFSGYSARESRAPSLAFRVFIVGISGQHPEKRPT